jgi:hypothetical protein
MSEKKAAVLWGAKRIGELINRNESQAHYLLERRRIKSARKVGGIWMANEDDLLKEFAAPASD